MTIAKSFIILCFLYINLYSYSQTGEHTLGFPLLHFDTTAIDQHSIKTIYHNNYTSDSLILDSKAIHTFDKNSNLLCGETRYYDTTEKVKRSTRDCYEYSDNGLQIEHKRYHSNSDSASWIQNFKYEFDEENRIIRISTEDLTVPHNSHTIFKSYYEDGKLKRKNYDYGTVEEYNYDEMNRLVEEISTSDFSNSKTKYTYDEKGNCVSVKFRGLMFDNHDLIEVNKSYDDNGLLIKIESVYSHETSYTILKYTQSGKLTKREYYDNLDNLMSYQNYKYSADLIKEITLCSDSGIIQKEVFEYEFYRH